MRFPSCNWNHAVHRIDTRKHGRKLFWIPFKITSHISDEVTAWIIRNAYAI